MPENRKCPQCGTPLPAGALAGLCPACLLKQGVANDTAQPDSLPFVPPSVAEIAQLFPQLEIIRLLGKGGMGAVYQARQPSLDRLVALKILPAHDGSDPGFAERFTREARALARLSHPNIVGVHEFGQAGNLHYFIMEFVDGVNLRQLQQTGRLSPRESLQIVPQLCDALQYAHDQGVVHRDIKPENVLMDRKGRVKIADFGLAKILDQDVEKLRLTGEGHVMGTPHYMSPEQVEHPLDVDHRADIYSLGVVFYEMLTGELPLGRFAPPSSKVQIDVRLDEVVLRTLEKEPDRRYQHASQVKTAVEDIGNSPNASPAGAAAASALAAEILARDYVLDIGGCLRRGWDLVKSDFWPLVGVTALILGLVSVLASNHFTGLFSLVLDGPLVGGLYLYFLKKIRREPATIETAFGGFSQRFLHLFLATFACVTLITLGCLCLLLPGIYVWIAWSFTRPLIMDKRLHFWAAMELSRKMVSKHWFKFFGFILLLLLINFAGLLCCVIGFFITAPITFAALVYAYEDLFGTLRQTTAPPASSAAASGTNISPSTPLPRASNASGSGCLKPLLITVGLIVALVVTIISVTTFVHWRHRRESVRAGNSATTEYWSPSVKSDERPDPTKILDEAKKLMESGKYDESNQRYLWYFNHALEYDPGLSGVRLSFALSDWAELGRRYPTARLAMSTICNRDTSQFYQGRGYSALFMDVAALNRYLQADDQTEELFENFRHDDRELARQCFPEVETLLVKNRKYKECLEYLPAPQPAFDNIVQSWQRTKKFEDDMVERRKDTQRRMQENNDRMRRERPEMSMPSFTPPEPPRTADNTFVNQTRELIEILVGTGKNREAGEIQFKAAALLPDERLNSAVRDAEERVQGEGSVNSADQSVDASPPVVVHTEPASGAHDVASGPTVIEVTFSKEMQDGSWSWNEAWNSSTPAKEADPTYGPDHKTCSLKVNLAPGKTYAYWLNTEKLQNFKDADGRPAVPYLLIFHTSGAPVADRSATETNQNN